MLKEIICISRFLLDAFWYVPKFAMLMRRRIWANRHKYIKCTSNHWKNDHAWGWLARIQDEVKELKHAMKVEAESYYPISLADAKQKRKLEAIDIANFAMMAAYAHEID